MQPFIAKLLHIIFINTFFDKVNKLLQSARNFWTAKMQIQSMYLDTQHFANLQLIFKVKKIQILSNLFTIYTFSSSTFFYTILKLTNTARSKQLRIVFIHFNCFIQNIIYLNTPYTSFIFPHINFKFYLITNIILNTRVRSFKLILTNLQSKYFNIDCGKINLFKAFNLELSCK